MGACELTPVRPAAQHPQRRPGSRVATCVPADWPDAGRDRQGLAGNPAGGMSGLLRKLCPGYKPWRGDGCACGRRRDGAPWLAWMSIRSGRYVPPSENPPGQPVALECPHRPRDGLRPAAEFVCQFSFGWQLGPRRVFAAPDPPREHRENVQVGPRVLLRIIHDQPHRHCKRLQPRRTARAHLEHPRLATPTGVVYAGDDLARSTAEADGPRSAET
jgi:hypothetical protein